MLDFRKHYRESGFSLTGALVATGIIALLAVISSKPTLFMKTCR